MRRPEIGIESREIAALAPISNEVWTSVALSGVCGSGKCRLSWNQKSCSTAGSFHVIGKSGAAAAAGSVVVIEAFLSLLMCPGR